MIRDTTLPLPTPTSPPRVLHGPDDALARAAPARDRPFALATPRVHVTGSALAGVSEVAVDGWPLLADLASDAGVCASVVIAPSELRRELTGPQGSVLETVLAGTRAGGTVTEWRATSATASPTLTLRWRVHVRGSVGSWADDDPEAWRSEGPLLGVRRRVSPFAPPELLFQLTPAPTWKVTPLEDGLGVEAIVRVPAGGHVTLVCSAGRDSADAAAGLAILAAAPAEEARAGRAAAELRSERLALDTGVRELDDALPWAAARIEGALGPAGFRRGSGGGADPEARFPFDAASGRAWCGLGALAAGDVTAALRAVPGRLDAPLHALLLGRIVAWTGEPERLEAMRVEAVQAAAGLDPSALTPAERVAWRCALDGWLDAAECLGTPPWAEPLRARRETLEAGSAAVSGGLRLPMVGGAPGNASGSAGPGGASGSGAPGDASGPDPRGDGGRDGGPPASLLAALFGGREADAYRPTAGEPSSAMERGLHAWAAYATGRPEEGFRLLRTHLAAGFDHAPGAWRAGPGHPRWDDAVAAAMAPAATLFGLMGARADAYYGRLHLAPRLPAHWTRLGVSGVRVGDARVVLRYSRRGEGHTFGIRQVGGRVPLTLVFEPEIASDRSLRVRVDGAPADVGIEPAGERVRVRLQLPLDRDREVCVEPDDAGAGDCTPGA